MHRNLASAKGSLSGLRVLSFNEMQPYKLLRQLKLVAFLAEHTEVTELVSSLHSLKGNRVVANMRHLPRSRFSFLMFLF